MLTGEDFAVLNEAYRTSREGRNRIQDLLSKVYDEDLALDLNRQALHFMHFEDRIVETLKREQEQPKGSSHWERAKSWTALQANAAWNASTSNMADLILQGNAGGLKRLLRTVKENKTAKREYCELADELMDFEEKNIEKMRSYLKNR